MSDAPEDEAPKAAKTARKRPAKRATKSAPAATETVVNLSAPEPMAPSEPVEKKPAVQTEPAAEPRPERTPREERPQSQSRPSSDFQDSDPVATFGEPPSSDAQGSGSKKRRRRKKNKHGQQSQQGGGGSQQIFQTAPTQGYASSQAAPVQDSPREAHAPQSQQGEGGGHAPVMHAAPRPKLDADEVARKAWKIFLAEVSEEGLALIGDNDARELSRRSFRLAEVFLEEATRRQNR